MPRRPFSISRGGFPGGAPAIAMEGMWKNTCRALLCAVIICGASGSISTHAQSHASKSRAGAEPFATFHLIDRRLSALGEESARLQQEIRSARNVKDSRPIWHKTAARMARNVVSIQEFALRLQRRYRNKAFAVRLFRRLRARAGSVASAVKIVRSTQSRARASSAALTVEKRITALGLQYNAITAGYAALQCAPGEWACCEPRPQSQTGPPDACRWLCTKEPPRCRGFVGARALDHR